MHDDPDETHHFQKGLRACSVSLQGLLVPTENTPFLSARCRSLSWRLNYPLNRCG